MAGHMSEPDWTTHIASGTAWKRFGIMLLLTPILGCVGFFVAFTALFQFFGVLANGEANPHLRRCGEDLSRYATSIIDFLTYNTERRPFPFAARTGNGADGGTQPAADRADTAPSRKPPARKTATRKRTTSKKTTARKKSSTKKTTRKSTSATPRPKPDTSSEPD